MRRYNALVWLAATGIVLSIAVSQRAGATLATSDEMEQLCSNWLTYTVNETGDWAGSRNPKIIESVEIRHDGHLLAVAYQIDPDGFIVVPVLKEMPPIKAFSESGHFTEDDYFGPGALLHDVLASRAERFIELYGDLTARQSSDAPMFDARNRQSWDCYLSSAIMQTREQVGPLISTTWHQTAPYNNYCPWGDGNRSVAWCVAIALAQIIRYHEWPPAGFSHTSYLWNGDQSCGGTSPGLLLTANFSDRLYYNDSNHDVAELCMEVGKAYHVDYGVCYSVGDTMPTYYLLPDYFAYQDSVQDNFRSDFTADDWFAAIQGEINSNRPIDYLVFNHMIACDGWMTVGEQQYYHMNYGWGGGSTLWYALDMLHCSWAGCDPMIEHMYTGIEPDRQIMFYADTLAGYAPLTLQFAASSSEDVSSWQWTFGDDDSSMEQNPEHTYLDPGIYDVTLRVEFDDTARTRTRTEYIYVLADSVDATASEVTPGSQLTVDVSARNLMPLTRILLPVSYAGDLELVYDSCSVQNCRTSHFQSVSELNPEPENRRLCLDLQAWVSGYSSEPFLEAGAGTVVKLYFTVPADAQPGQQSVIDFDGYDEYQPQFYGSIYGFEHLYEPETSHLTVAIDVVCGDADGSEEVDIDDVVYLIGYIFSGGPEPAPYESGDADCSDDVDIDDVVWLIGYIFSGGNAPCDTDGDEVPDC